MSHAGAPRVFENKRFRAAEQTEIGGFSRRFFHGISHTPKEFTSRTRNFGNARGSYTSPDTKYTVVDGISTSTADRFVLKAVEKHGRVFVVVTAFGAAFEARALFYVTRGVFPNGLPERALVALENYVPK